MKDNIIVCSDNVSYMKSLPDESIDMIVTSPPYDNLRAYNGFTLDLHAVGVQAFRILKTGGIAAVVIQDITQNLNK